MVGALLQPLVTTRHHRHRNNPRSPRIPNNLPLSNLPVHLPRLQIGFPPSQPSRIRQWQHHKATTLVHRIVATRFLRWLARSCPMCIVQAIRWLWWGELTCSILRIKWEVQCTPTTRDNSSNKMTDLSNVTNVHSPSIETTI